MDNIGSLLLKTCKAHRGLIARRLDNIGLYPGQDGLIYHLSANDGLTMSELVTKMKIKHPTLFAMVNRMVKAGIIKKTKDKIDKRTSRIYLTAKGRKLVAQLSRIWQEIETQLLGGMDKDEKYYAMMILKKIIHNSDEDNV